MELDLTRIGLRLDHLGTRRLRWRLLVSVVKYAPPDSALMRATFGAQVAWSTTEHLLASLVEMVNWLVWAKTEDAQHGRNRPKPIQRPGVARQDGQVLGKGGFATYDEFKARYAQIAAAQVAARAAQEADGGGSDGV